MHYSYKLRHGVKAFLPPQGLLVIAAYLPDEWQVRFIDENKAPATPRDYCWADAVFISGMHVQREHILAINNRAHVQGKVTVLGGASVSASPEWYSEVDILHCGELGDATDRIIDRLDRGVERPVKQEIYRTIERLPLDKFPMPAYDKVNLTEYFLASIQFSSGCPFTCEFCDIPALYGRRPRLKTPSQVTAELDAILTRGNPGAVYFVDDNFIANPKAALGLLEYLVKWQQERGYPVEFACEATLNLAQFPKILNAMREAYFCTVFCGIETPDEAGLDVIHKEQNKREPLLSSIRRLNSYGLEVVSGIIVGIDSDTAATGGQISRFIEESAIPVLTVNMLHALPKTPLWTRLEQAGRLVNIPGRESNVEFVLPYEQVERTWLGCIERAYTPEAIYARFDHQIVHTYPRRKQLPSAPNKGGLVLILHGAATLLRILWFVGICSDYRRRFWQTALPAIKQGKIRECAHSAIVSHHMILFARDCQNGTAEKCFYSASKYGGAPRGGTGTAPTRPRTTPIARDTCSPAAPLHKT